MKDSEQIMARSEESGVRSNRAETISCSSLLAPRSSKSARSKELGVRSKDLNPSLLAPRSSLQKGFTLIDILVAMTILSIVMSILYGTFSTSSANAKVVEERADELSSLTGALDILSQEVREAYPPIEGSIDGFSGKSEEITFTAITPLVKDDEPRIQRVSYAFSDGKLLRKTFKYGIETESKGEFLLLDGVKDPSFSFYDGKEWVEEWPSAKNLPPGIKVAFSYKDRNVETVIPILSAKKYP